MDRQTKRELKTPDQIWLTSKSIFEWASGQWALLLILLGLIFVGVIAVTVGVQYKRKAEAEAQLHYSQAKAYFEQVQVGGEKEKAEAQSKFNTEYEILSTQHSSSTAFALGGLLKAQLLVEQGKGAEAAQELERAQKNLPKAQRDIALYPLAIVFENTEKWNEALSAYDSLLKDEKSAYATEALLGKGRALRALGRGTDAVKIYEKFLEKYPQRPEISVVRGLIAELKAQPGSKE